MQILNLYGTRVASHAEAWIETFTVSVHATDSHVASHAEAWIETCIDTAVFFNPERRLSCRGVD